MEHLKLRKWKLAELISMEHHWAPWLDRWAIHGAVHFVTNCQYCTKFSICYLNDNVSTPVFSPSSIVTCNHTEFQAKILWCKVTKNKCSSAIVRCKKLLISIYIYIPSIATQLIIIWISNTQHVSATKGFYQVSITKIIRKKLYTHSLSLSLYIYTHYKIQLHPNPASRQSTKKHNTY